MLKFYSYNFTEEKTTEEIISDIEYICERTKQYDREEEMMFFAFVPVVSLEAVCACFKSRKLVKIATHGFTVNSVSSELSLKKLSELKVDMAVTGLADRRYFLGESDETVRDNLEAVLRLGLKSSLCVGETLEMKENSTAAEVIAAQVRTGCEKIPAESYYRTGFMYRPLWEFDCSYEAELGYTMSMLSLIKETARAARPDFPFELPLLYGGRASAQTVKELFDSQAIDGVMFDSKNVSAQDFADMINEIG